MFAGLQILNRIRESAYNACCVFHLLFISRDSIFNDSLANICESVISSFRGRNTVTLLHHMREIFLFILNLQASSAQNIVGIKLHGESVNERMK